MTSSESMRLALAAVLDSEVSEPVLLAGGASKEAWAVDAGGDKLLVRRAASGVIHSHTLSLEHEYAVLKTAYGEGVKAPRPVLYIDDLDGREAFVMERLAGETIGRRIVRMSPMPTALPLQMAEEMAKIHAIPPERVPFVGEAHIEHLVDELDAVGEPRPAIELGLWWLRENPPHSRPPVVSHGDFRIGNIVVDAHGLVGVLDWEFVHLGDPIRDLAFPCVRAWRFGVPGKRLGGIAGVEPYLRRYSDATGLDVSMEEVDYWEIAGNVRWAIGCLTQMHRHLSGRDRSIELAVLGRLGAEVEYELLHLLERQGVQ